MKVPVVKPLTLPEPSDDDVDADTVVSFTDVDGAIAIDTAAGAVDPATPVTDDVFLVWSASPKALRPASTAHYTASSSEPLS